MHRRTLLGLVASGTASLAGCLSGSEPTGTDDEPGTGTDAIGSDDGTTDRTDSEGTETADGTETAEPTALPESCPTTQGLDVEWPSDLDASAVESFVAAYEAAYYREVVVEYEPDSRLDSYDLSGSVNDSPTAVGDGWTLSYSGSGGVYRPTLSLGATTADPPADADVASIDDVDDGALVDLLTSAAETGAAEHHVEPPGEEVDRYVDLLASLSGDFDRLSGPGESDSLFVDVDGTSVELSAQATNFHGDYWWSATYYVDERVVRRTADDDTDPRNGELLECRTGGD
ncbi:hypothetical protein [Halosimplex salinum]|uniref:hypothetical protein n=1 Tax=Halosimplex salinum TaxID=1710538 RepID=UPI000F4771EB|nr:hypothetical protein [Halosimplex salinum]